MKSKALIDVPVLCLFFNRPDNFRHVFEQVKQARPSKLFLYQDGPRNDNDLSGIQACRDIANEIDWDCEVHRLYQKHNFGCDPSEFISQKWAFSYVDKCIVLEDDDVPAISFFSFCKELLDYYEKDFRIYMISGMNYEEQTKDCPYDYFFTSDVAIWGWATWKRVVDQWDGKYAFTKNEYCMKMYSNLVKTRNYSNNLIPATIRHSRSGIEYYETILTACMHLNNGLAIVPKYNMINNIGLTGGAHLNTNLDTKCKHSRRIFEMKRFEMEFPIKHQQYVVEDVDYIRRLSIILDRNRPLHRLYHRALNFLIRTVKRTYK